MILKAQGGINRIEKCPQTVMLLFTAIVWEEESISVSLRYTHRHSGCGLRRQGGSGGLYCRCRHTAATSAHYRSRVVPRVGVTGRDFGADEA